MASPHLPKDVPKSGARLVAKSTPHDLRFLASLSQGVQSVARHQEAAGEDLDDAEFHPVAGPYDWRAYIHEEFRLARMRAEAPEDFE